MMVIIKYRIFNNYKIYLFNKDNNKKAFLFNKNYNNKNNKKILTKRF